MRAGLSRIIHVLFQGCSADFEPAAGKTQHAREREKAGPTEATDFPGTSQSQRNVTPTDLPVIHPTHRDSQKI